MPSTATWLDPLEWLEEQLEEASPLQLEEFPLSEQPVLQQVNLFKPERSKRSMTSAKGSTSFSQNTKTSGPANGDSFLCQCSQTPSSTITSSSAIFFIHQQTVLRRHLTRWQRTLYTEYSTTLRLRKR